MTLSLFFSADEPKNCRCHAWWMFVAAVVVVLSLARHHPLLLPLPRHVRCTKVPRRTKRNSNNNKVGAWLCTTVKMTRVFSSSWSLQLYSDEESLVRFFSNSHTNIMSVITWACVTHIWKRNRDCEPILLLTHPQSLHDPNKWPAQHRCAFSFFQKPTEETRRETRLLYPLLLYKNHNTTIQTPQSTIHYHHNAFIQVQ